MTMIHILENDLPFSKELTNLFDARRVSVSSGTIEQSDGFEILVCSQTQIDELPQRKALIEQAKKYGVRKIVSFTDAADFSVEDDLGGRILKIALPACSKDLSPSHNASLLAATDIICDDIISMVACDPNTSNLIDLAQCVAQSDVTVFINGPTGSGKEVLARLVHEKSQRCGSNFIALNCAAIPENMLEAMLFGHEKGSFTGAATANQGFIRAADGGTLLLDEISEMPLALQSKLLRVLQERVVTPLGSQKEIKVDIRIIATSNRDMIEAVSVGTFREDLYYRLNVFPLETVALSERKFDIPALATRFLRRHHSAANQSCPLLSEAAIEVLMAHDWPGNVRELENVMQRALVLCQGPRVEASDIMIKMTCAAEKLRQSMAAQRDISNVAAQ